MKTILAIFAACVMFVLTFIVVGLLIASVWPYSRIEIVIGEAMTNLASILAFILACLAAVHSFRATLKSKPGKSNKKKAQPATEEVPS